MKSIIYCGLSAILLSAVLLAGNVRPVLAQDAKGDPDEKQSTEEEAGIIEEEEEEEDVNDTQPEESSASSEEAEEEETAEYINPYELTEEEINKLEWSYADVLLQIAFMEMKIKVLELDIIKKTGAGEDTEENEQEIEELRVQLMEWGCQEEVLKTTLEHAYLGPPPAAPPVPPVAPPAPPAPPAPGELP